MKNMFKKAFFITALMALMTVLFCFGASALAETTQCGDNVYGYYDRSTGELVISGTGAMWGYSYNYSPFYDTDIKSVVIKSGVTTIGDRAFCPCRNLTSVTIPDSVTTIGEYAFSSCYSLTSVTIPDSVTTIGEDAFSGCESLTSVTIGNSVTTIGDSAFEECFSLKSVTIPDSVTTIGNRAFSCDSLTSVTVDKNNKYYCNDSYGVLFDKNKTKLIQYPIGNKRTVYTIPDSVTTIGNSAFCGCDSLQSVTIGNSVTTIGNSAFRGCDSLQSVTIPDSVTTIGDSAFCYCYRLTSVTIGNSVTTIGDYAFASCDSLTSITIPDSVTTIGSYAFAYCDSLTSVTIGNSVTTIGDHAFYYCDSLKDVYYCGTEEQWKKISIGSYNSSLTGANIHYNHIHEYTSVVAKEATCTAIGLRIYTCCCGAVNKTEEIPAINHKNATQHAQQNATCTEIGYTAGKQCSHCEEWISGHEEIPALDHSYTSTVTTAPTCTSKGVKTYVCQNDNTHTYTEEIAVDSANHVNKADIPQQDATCENIGYTAGVYCNDCKKWISGHKKLSATGHKYTPNFITKATLTTNGKVIMKCSSCGDSYSKATYAVTTISLSSTKYIYDGTNKTPKVTVKDKKGNALVKGKDYKIAVASKRSGVGRYTVKVTLMGNYEGSKNLYFYILPGAPAAVKSAAQSSSAIKLSWSAVKGAAGYTVYRYSPSRSAYVKVVTTSQTSATAKSLSSGTKYIFKVVAYSKTSAGKVYYSEKYTLLKTVTKTKTPSLTVTSPSKGEAALKWTNVSGETGYQIYYSTSKNGTYKKYTNCGVNATNGSIYGLTSSKTYYFKIRTYIKTDSGYVYSPFSAVKSVKVK